jgi:hypothetical protein
MSDPEAQDVKEDELDLEAETVRDLEPNEKDAENIRGGVYDDADYRTGGSKPC